VIDAWILYSDMLSAVATAVSAAEASQTPEEGENPDQEVHREEKEEEEEDSDDSDEIDSAPPRTGKELWCEAARLKLSTMAAVQAMLRVEAAPGAKIICSQPESKERTKKGSAVEEMEEETVARGKRGKKGGKGLREGQKGGRGRGEARNGRKQSRGQQRRQPRGHGKHRAEESEEMNEELEEMKGRESLVEAGLPVLPLPDRPAAELVPLLVQLLRIPPSGLDGMGGPQGRACCIAHLKQLCNALFGADEVPKTGLWYTRFGGTCFLP